MKKIILVISVMFAAPWVLWAQSAEIDWGINLDTAKQVAIQNSKPLVIFFTNEPPGQIGTSVFNNVLTDSNIVRRVEQSFVPVLIRGDMLLQNKYLVRRFPTLLIVDGRDQELNRLTGIEISIDKVVDVLDASLVNLAQLGSLANPGLGSSSGMEGVGQTYSYTSGSGSFVKQEDGVWYHETPFYKFKYTETKADRRHFYIVSEDKKIHVAVPKSSGNVVWVWDEDQNQWISAKNITISAVEQSR